MAKRKSKQATEAEGKARLRQRLMDIATASNGGCGIGSSTIWRELDPLCFIDFVRVISNSFPSADATFSLWSLHHFAELDTAVDHLWERGVRP